MEIKYYPLAGIGSDFQDFCMKYRMRVEHLTMSVGAFVVGKFCSPLGDILATKGHELLDEYIQDMRWPPLSWKQFIDNGQLLQEMSKEFFALGQETAKKLT